MNDDPYRTLGVRHDASPEEIKRAYRRTVRRCHPDLHPQAQDARAEFLRVQAAFEVLMDPERRRAYNRATVSSFDPVQREPFRPVCAGQSNDPTDGYRTLVRQAAAQVSEPVIGLTITVGLGMSLHCLALVSQLCHAEDGPAAEAAPEIPAFLPGGFGLVLGLVSCVLAWVVVAGLVQMKNLENYRLARLGAVMATLCCLSPWFLPAVPFGVWALVVLRSDQVRDAFWS